MFHLFNKVYLKPDVLIKLTRQRIVISELYSGMVAAPYTAYDDVIGRNYIPPTAEAKSFTTLLEQEYGGSPVTFFKTLFENSNGPRITIYVDIQSMLDIATRWLKTIYPRWSPSQATTVLRMIVLNYRTTVASGRTRHNKIYHPGTRDEYGAALDVILDNEYAELEARWIRTRPVRIDAVTLRAMKDAASVEWQLAAVLDDVRTTYSAHLKKKITAIVKSEAVGNIASTIREEVLEGVATIDTLFPGTNYDIFSEDLYSLAARVPALNFLIDDHFTCDNAEYVYNRYDMSIFRDLNRRLRALAPDYGTAFDELLVNDLDFDKIQLLHSDGDGAQSRFLKRAITIENINPLIVGFVLTATPEQRRFMILE